MHLLPGPSRIIVFHVKAEIDKLEALEQCVKYVLSTRRGDATGRYASYIFTLGLYLNSTSTIYIHQLLLVSRYDFSRDD
jgi:hypothetical protein